MYDTLVLPRGRQFEETVLGQHGNLSDERPLYFDYKESLKHIINLNWANYERSLKGGAEWHNPANPSRGLTAKLWKAVRDPLLYFADEDTRDPDPLNLYLSVGFNSLDHYHGVDAFFWWYGAAATIDLCLFNKQREEGLKADFLLMPSDLLGPNLELFGEHVALFLERELLNQKIRTIEKKRLALHHLSDYLRT